MAGSEEDWDEYFMAEAIRSADESKNTSPVGACIVKDKNKIISTGYNGRSNDPHAEVMAIQKVTLSDRRDYKMYVTLFPCDVCANKIIHTKIKEVIYKDEKNIHYVNSTNWKQKSSPIFNKAGVAYRQYIPKNNEK
ncbi:PREDICTED: deoxycytidylate deaminase-like [Dinoponera quadriceps]|uniref:dCMP deaminase n=1 Tax=Dinoponera quadriceps TaxID=609295 RepID=A0A6P3XIN8_DINQU|nr:PREDICTED: deoxycytidylate deaminase-like [Dinoponera quadriceps]